jgi:hypothetical protein
VVPTKGRGYAPAIFESMPEANGFKSKALALSMERLFFCTSYQGRDEWPAVKTPHSACAHLWMRRMIVEPQMRHRRHPWLESPAELLLQHC